MLTECSHRQNRRHPFFAPVDEELRARVLSAESESHSPLEQVAAQGGETRRVVGVEVGVERNTRGFFPVELLEACNHHVEVGKCRQIKGPIASLPRILGRQRVRRETRA